METAVNWELLGCGVCHMAVQCMLGKLTETCPDKTLGLMGDVTDIDGPTFWESKELEPERTTQNSENETENGPISVYRLEHISLYYI